MIVSRIFYWFRATTKCSYAGGVARETVAVLPVSAAHADGKFRLPAKLDSSGYDAGYGDECLVDSDRNLPSEWSPDMTVSPHPYLRPLVAWHGGFRFFTSKTWYRQHGIEPEVGSYHYSSLIMYLPFLLLF